jgi:hypothetical protein
MDEPRKHANDGDERGDLEHAPYGEKETWKHRCECP